MFKRILTALLAVLMLVPLFCFNAFAADEVISVGKKYTLEYSTPIANAYPKKAYKQEKALTDGKIAQQATYSDKAFVELYRGTSVSVTIDLESVMAVSSVTIGELQSKTAGIVCSRYLEVYVSEDGNEYGFAGKVEAPSYPTEVNQRRVELKATLDKAYKARYVRAVFSSDIFTYVDEVSVYGSKDISGAASAPKYENKDKNAFSGDIDGIKSVCLMYVASNYTKDMMKPYFAYMQGGKPVDTMFDSLLFLGMTETTSSDGFMRQQDMINFVDKVMAPNNNMGALNTVVGEYKDDLGLAADYKYPVFFSVPNIGLYYNSFGEIDGNAITSNNLTNRSKIVKWYIDYVEKTFSEKGFENLELKGFYWFAEAINYQHSTHEEDLIKYFNEYSHEKGYKTMWIPYYSAAGIDVAKDLGFDSVTMQSGYAFDGGTEVGQAKAGVCNDAAATAKKLGLNGIEFELDIYKSEYAKRFQKYVSAAYGAGVMENGMITMYQVGDNLYTSSLGTGTSRSVYDLTYQFISGQYKESAPVIKEGATVTLKVDDIANGKLVITDEDSKKTDLKIANIVKPEGVYFFAEGNGYFEVQTYGCQPGTYKASLSVTDGNNESNTVEITIIVEPAENAEASDTSDAGNGENGGNTLMIVLIIIGGVVILAAIAFAVLKLRSSKKDKK